jgi:hypothetical protein
LTFDELILKPQTISYAEDWMPNPQLLVIKPLAGRLAKASGCDALPINLTGQTKLFQQASRTAFTLRLGLYMHEIKKRLEQPIHFELMPIIENEHIPDIPEQVLAHWSTNQLFSGNGINSFSPGT